MLPSSPGPPSPFPLLILPPPATVVMVPVTPLLIPAPIPVPDPDPKLLPCAVINPVTRRIRLLYQSQMNRLVPTPFPPITLIDAGMTTTEEGKYKFAEVAGPKSPEKPENPRIPATVIMVDTTTDALPLSGLENG